MKKLGIVMDPIQSIVFSKDSTLAMLLEASKQGYEIYYLEQKDLFVEGGEAYGNSKTLKVYNDANHWFDFTAESKMKLGDLDVILMRKDPPFDLEFIYTTYILELAEKSGVKVVNRPSSLRDFNEKFYISYFNNLTAKTLIAKEKTLIKAFHEKHKKIVLKPLDAMGGAEIFKLNYPDDNAEALIDAITHNGERTIMAQKYIPEIQEGDKRILLIDGEPLPYLLLRIPAKGDWRGNLAKGAKAIAKPLSKNDINICAQIGPKLRENGILFAGIDVIGDFVTEINITSPTCIRELDTQCDMNISEMIFSRLNVIAS